MRSTQAWLVTIVTAGLIAATSGCGDSPAHNPTGASAIGPSAGTSALGSGFGSSPALVEVTLPAGQALRGSATTQIVCHVRRDGRVAPLRLAAGAMRAHLRHGDARPTAFHPDADGDGFGDADSSPTLACAPLPGHVADASDCDDGDAAINPFASESCDSVDNDCDGLVDEGAACEIACPCDALFADAIARWEGASGPLSGTYSVFGSSSATCTDDRFQTSTDFLILSSQAGSNPGRGCLAQVRLGVAFVVNELIVASETERASCVASLQALCTP